MNVSDVEKGDAKGRKSCSEKVYRRGRGERRGRQNSEESEGSRETLREEGKRQYKGVEKRNAEDAGNAEEGRGRKRNRRRTAERRGVERRVEQEGVGTACRPTQSADLKAVHGHKEQTPRRHGVVRYPHCQVVLNSSGRGGRPSIRRHASTSNLAIGLTPNP